MIIFMKKLYILFLFATTVLHAQIPIRFANRNYKGDVVKVEERFYYNVPVGADGEPEITGNALQRYVTILENGNPVSVTGYSGADRKEMLQSRTDITREKGQITKVQEYYNKRQDDRAPLQLRETATPFYKGKNIISENVTDADGNLTAVFTYQKPVKYKGNPLSLYEKETYEKGVVKKKERFGQQANERTTLLMFTIENGDSTFVFRSTLDEPTRSAAVMQIKAVGNIRTISTHNTLQFDAKGNKTRTVITDDKNKKFATVILSRYQYKGDPELEEFIPPFDITTIYQTAGSWSNLRDNITLDFSGKEKNKGTYTSKPRTPVDMEGIMSSDEEWIFDLQQTTGGNWSFDAASGVLTLAPVGKRSIDVLLSKEDKSLVLTPVKPNMKTLYLTTWFDPENEVEVVVEAPPPPPAKVPVQEPTEPERFYSFVEKEPSFPGGEAEMLQFISNNLKYPVIARENGIEGRVVVSFIVQKNGTLTDLQIIRDIGGGCGEEAIRVIESMPRWIPGTTHGNAVKAKYTLPVAFKLN